MADTVEFYRTQAKACADAAARSDLDNQRDKYLSAQRAWEVLADRTAKIQSDRDARLADAKAREDAER